MKDFSKSERYKKAQTYTEQEKLPAGGYVLGIVDAKEQSGDYGDTLIIAFDIIEGEYKGFYQRNLESQTREDKAWKGKYRVPVPKDDGSEQDEWKMRRLKTVVYNIEESNPGYHFDWDNVGSLKGKKIGALFNNKEYEFNGHHGFYTNCHSLVPVENIRSGKFKIPEDTLLRRNGRAQPQPSPVGDGFMTIPEGAEDEFPFI
jgi:hypothetical protein